MFVPFSYTKYRSSKLATVISFFGGLFIAMGILCAVALVMEGEFMGVVMGAMFALVGLGLNKLAEGIAHKKNGPTS